MIENLGSESLAGLLREAEQPPLDVRLLERILDALDEPISIIDAGFRVRYMNRAARLLFGGRTGAVEGSRCHLISHHRGAPCTGDDHPCPMTAARETGRSVRVLHEHYDRAGGRRVVEIIASPIEGEDGVFSGIIESQRDVTAREQANERVRRYAAELERSTRLKDLFIDIMRHDLLGPAGVIRSAAALGLRSGGDPSRRDDLDLIHQCSQRMIELIQNASALARLEAEEQLALEPTDIDAMVRGVAAELAPFAAERGTLVTVAGAAGGAVPANPVLASVFSNIIGNAIKYSPENSVVEVLISRRAGGVLVSVADQGEGIPDDAKEAVFTRFTRLHKGEVKGAGLGLAIVKKVVELHGGRAWVTDAPGGGSVFNVRLESA